MCISGQKMIFPGGGNGGFLPGTGRIKEHRRRTRGLNGGNERCPDGDLATRN